MMTLWMCAALLAAPALATEPADYTEPAPPSVTIKAPSHGQTVQGSLPVSVDAAADSAIREVILFVDGSTVAVSWSAPAAFTLDATQFSDGKHTLSAKAISKGNGSGTASIDIMVINSGHKPGKPAPSPEREYARRNPWRIGVDGGYAMKPLLEKVKYPAGTSPITYKPALLPGARAGYALASWFELGLAAGETTFKEKSPSPTAANPDAKLSYVDVSVRLARPIEHDSKTGESSYYEPFLQLGGGTYDLTSDLSAKKKFRGGSFALGLDVRVTPHLSLGFAIGAQALSLGDHAMFVVLDPDFRATWRFSL
jgi:hypothetical protein